MTICDACAVEPAPPTPAAIGTGTIDVRRARDGELAAAFALRHEVFCVEQGVSVADELDGRDDEALQLVAVRSRDGRLVGTCRVLIEGATAKLGRMAVPRDARGAGIGSALLASAELAARRAGASRVALNAQLAARGLYARAGYVENGPSFVEAGIDHVGMERRLDA
jgi:predicted GNAT family N-acyltransferase